MLLSPKMVRPVIVDVLSDELPLGRGTHLEDHEAALGPTSQVPNLQDVGVVEKKVILDRSAPNSLPSRRRMVGRYPKTMKEHMRSR